MWCFSQPRDEDPQGIKLYELLAERIYRTYLYESVYIYDRLFSFKYWLFCTFSCKMENSGFENYIMTLLAMDCDLRVQPVHVHKNLIIKYTPTISGESKMYTNTMGLDICDLAMCEHELRSAVGRWVVLHEVVKVVLQMIFGKVKTMTWELLIKDVTHTVGEIAVRFAVLVAPRLVYDLFVAAKRLDDNLNYIDQNCKCLRILSNYCHCEVLHYFCKK